MKLSAGNTYRMMAATLAIVLLGASVPKVKGQDDANDRQLRFEVMPLAGSDLEAFENGAVPPGSPSLKMWKYTATSTRSGSVGKKYTGYMVGNSPFTTNGTTTTTVYVVPLIVQIGAVTFDPTKADAACYGGIVPLDALKTSPMVMTWHDFKINGIDVGSAQYSDAFQRANFWKEVSGKGGTYHNKLNYKYLAPVTIAPSAAISNLYSTPGLCTPQYGGIEVNAFDTILKLLIPGLGPLGVNPGNLVTFMLYNVTLYDTTPTNCCIGGYHGAYGAPVQTYSPFQYDTAGFFGTAGMDTAIMSHEINEWQDDPLGNNPTPAWGHVGQVSGCQTNLEVGDPLSGTDLPAIKLLTLPYHLQELAFYSWFYGGPSLGAGGKYSDHGTFTKAQGKCS